MTMIREFSSSFTKIKRMPILLLHLILPVMITTLFLVYYASAGYRIIPDVRSFFVLIQIGYPIFVGVSVPVYIHLDRNHGIQNALGLVQSRNSVYMGKLFFLLFLSAISMIIYEVCFYIGVNLFLDMDITHLGTYLNIFFNFLMGSLFLYVLHVPITFRFGSSVSVLLGISGAILAGLFENPIGDKVWPVIPWEWGVRFMECFLGRSDTALFHGLISFFIINTMVLVISLLWFRGWEGKITQE